MFQKSLMNEESTFVTRLFISGYKNIVKLFIASGKNVLAQMMIFGEQMKLILK